MQDDVDDTVIRARAPLPSAPLERSAVLDPSAVVDPSAVLDPSAAEDTVIRPRSSSAPAVLPPIPSPDVGSAIAERVASIRVGDRVLRLDRPVVIGRRPAPSRVTIGPEPVLVAVGRSHGQVSGSHVAIRAEGQSVVVEDLRSTNGTLVRPPGAAAYRMPAGAARVVLTGTLVEIGDGVVIEILSPHLRPANGTVLAPPPTRERSTP